MAIENLTIQSELVNSLASTIRERIVAPAEGRVDSLSHEINEIKGRLALLERESASLAAAHSRTGRLTARAAVLGAAALAAALIIPFIKG